MLLAIESPPISIAVLGEYKYFCLKHDWSAESMSALVLNDSAIERTVTRASTEFGFQRITKEEFVVVINNAMTDRNTLRSLLADSDFTVADADAQAEFQRILLRQISDYLKTAKQELDDAGIKHSVKPGVGLALDI